MRYKPEKPIEPDRSKYVTFQHVAYIDEDFSAEKLLALVKDNPGLCVREVDSDDNYNLNVYAFVVETGIDSVAYEKSLAWYKKQKARYTKQLREFKAAVKAEQQVIEARLVERERRELERLQKKYSEVL